MNDPPGDSADQAAAKAGILVLPFRQQQVITITVIPKVLKRARIQLMVRIDLKDPFGARIDREPVTTKNGGTMTGIALRDDLHRSIPEFFKQPNTIVRRSVVNKKNLVRDPGPQKKRLPVAKERYQVVLLVVDGNDDRQSRTIWHGLSGLVEEYPSRKYPAPG